MRGFIGAAVALLTFAACSATEPAPAALPGTYSLVSLNGEPIQVSLARDGWGTKSATLRVQSDGQFDETIVAVRPPGYEPHEQEVTFHGEWSDEGGSYSFLWTDARVFPMVGTLSGRSLTLRTDAGAERVYQR